VASEKLTSELERYTVHKHFYENWRAKFPIIPTKKLWVLFGCFSYNFVESAN